MTEPKGPLTSATHAEKGLLRFCSDPSMLLQRSIPNQDSLRRSPLPGEMYCKLGRKLSPETMSLVGALLWSRALYPCHAHDPSRASGCIPSGRYGHIRFPEPLASAARRQGFPPSRRRRSPAKWRLPAPIVSGKWPKGTAWTKNFAWLATESGVCVCVQF